MARVWHYPDCSQRSLRTCNSPMAPSECQKNCSPILARNGLTTNEHEWTQMMISCYAKKKCFKLLAVRLRFSTPLVAGWLRSHTKMRWSRSEERRVGKEC